MATSSPVNPVNPAVRYRLEDLHGNQYETLETHTEATIRGVALRSELQRSVTIVEVDRAGLSEKDRRRRGSDRAQGKEQ